MKLYIYLLIINILFLLFSCNRVKDEKMSVNKDSLTLGELANIYDKSRSKDDLKIFLHKIDTLIHAKNKNITYDNVGLISTKLITLTDSDSVNSHLTDSLFHELLSFYKAMLSDKPCDPNIYIDLAQMYYYPQANNVDSADYYLNRSLFLCDSILEKNPYEEETYRLKIYTLLLLDKIQDAQVILERDKKIKKDDKSVMKFLKELSNEINPD